MALMQKKAESTQPAREQSPEKTKADAETGVASLQQKSGSTPNQNANEQSTDTQVSSEKQTMNGISNGEVHTNTDAMLTLGAATVGPLELCFELIGECYVDGQMDGEVIRLQKDEQRFKIV
jgi:hypothetical protein